MTISEQEIKGEFKINFEWVEELSDSTSREFNELSTTVQNLIRQLLSSDAKYIKKIDVSFR